MHDIAIAKYAAGRDKDLRYTNDLWANGMLDFETLTERLRNTELKPTDKPREWIEAVIRRHQRLHDTARHPRARLGVPTIINAKGTATRVSGAPMPPEIAAAMQEATQHCVDMAPSSRAGRAKSSRRRPGPRRAW